MLPPKSLRNDHFRFCKVIKNGKRAFEKAFNTSDVAYNYLSCDLFGKWCMSNGGNYGVLCGYGGLFILDFDDKETFMKVKNKLPPTMMVTSAGKGLPHLYYYANDVKDVDIKTVLFDTMDGGVSRRIIDLQGFGKYCVGPGSKIDMKEYKLLVDLPIATVRYKNIVSLLQEVFPLIHVAKTKVPKSVKYAKRVKKGDDDWVWKIKTSVSMPQLLHHLGSNTSMKRTQCPICTESVSGKCVAFESEIYYCFHGCHGGDIFELLMRFKGYDFPDAIAWFKKEFHIK